MLRKLPSLQPKSSHHPPGAVSYNVTLHQHQAPPGAHDGKAADTKLAKAPVRKLINQSEERSQFSNKTYGNDTSSKFPYKVYEMSTGRKSQTGTQENGAFALHEFDRLDTLLNLTLIHKKRALDISRYLVDIGKATIETGLRMVQIHIKNETQNKRDINAVKIGRRLISAGEKILSRGEKVLKEVTRSKGIKLSTTKNPRIKTTKLLELQVVTPVIKMISLCSHGPPHYGVTLLGGIRAGHFVGHGKVDNMQACIKKCCANHQCDLAFMVKEDCYSVICYHKKLCRSVRARHVRKYQPRIAHIWRGPNEEKQSVTSHATSHPRKSRIMENKPIQLHQQTEESVIGNAKSGPTLQKQQKIKLILGDEHEKESVTDRTKTRPTNTASRNGAKSARKYKLTPAYKKEQSVPKKHMFTKGNGSHLVSSNLSNYTPKSDKSPFSASARASVDSTELPAGKNVKRKLSASKASSKKDLVVERTRLKSPLAVNHSHSSIAHEAKPAAHKHPGHAKSQSACTYSAIEHNVGLRYGLKTGHFSYIGELLHIKACLEVCCHDSDCDVAFMLDQSCYTVNCTNESVCCSVPYHEHKYSTKAVFVTRRFNKAASWHADLQHTLNPKSSSTRYLPAVKRILQNSVATKTAIHNSLHTLVTKATSTTSPLQSSVTAATVNHGKDHLNLRPLKKQVPSIAHSYVKETSINPNSYIKMELQRYASLSSKKNSSEQWKNENIKIDLYGGQVLTSKEKESDFIKNKSNQRNNEEWQQTNITVHLPNVHNLKQSPSSEKVKVNFLGLQNVTQNGKDFHSLGTKEIKSGGDQWQDEEINVHLPSSLNDNSSLTIYPDQNTSTGINADMRDRVTNLRPPVSFSNATSLDGKEIADKREKGSQSERRGERNKETAHQRSGTLKIKVNLGDGSSLPHSEPNYYAALSGNSKVLFKGENENIASAESGVYGNIGLRIKVHLKSENSLLQGEPDYYEPIPMSPSSKANAELFRDADEQSGSTESGISSSSTSGSGKHFDTGHAVDISYPESNESDESLTPYGSAELDTEKVLHLKSDNCTSIDTYYNVTLRGGLKAGNFTFVGIASSKEDCVTYCCTTNGCDVAFIVLKRCFLVDCHDDKLCDIVAARNADKFRPVITYVNLTIIKAQQSRLKGGNSVVSKNINKTYVSRERQNASVYGEKPFTYNRKAAPSTGLNQTECTFSAAFHNMSFRLGRLAGVFTNQGPAHGIQECAQRCCRSPYCDIAFMISQDCFSVRCYSNKTCETFAIHGSDFNPGLVFVQRYGVNLENRAKGNYSTGNEVVTPSRSQWSMNTTSNTAFYPKMVLPDYMSSTAAINTAATSANVSFPPEAAVLNNASFEDDTSEENTEPEVKLPPEVPSSDFVEVKTNGSEFWWQNYAPEDENLANSSFETVLPDTSDNTSNLMTGLESKASLRNQIPTEIPPTNVTPSIAKVPSEEDAGLLTIHIPENNTFTNSSFKMVLPDAPKDPRNSTNSIPPQVIDDSHSHKSNFKVTLPEVNSQTNYFLSKSLEKRPAHEQFEKEQGLCSQVKEVSRVTLKGGYYAGIFSRQDNATSMKECVSECCRLPECNLAFMVAKVCYTVQCFSNEKCTSVKAHYANKYHPRMAFIRPFDDSSLDGFKAHETDSGVIRNRLRCVLDDISDPKYKLQNGSFITHSSSHDLGDCTKLCCRTSGCEVASQENGTCYSMNCHGNLKCPETYLSNSSRLVGVIKDLIKTQNTSEHSASVACDFSPVLHEVVLRGGSHSGKFKYLLEVDDMETCIKECCIHKVCDVALMLKDNCFLVSCHNEMLCDAIPTLSSEYHPQIAYKIKHGNRRHVGKE